jgi:hypothetical protein
MKQFAESQRELQAQGRPTIVLGVIPIGPPAEAAALNIGSGMRPVAGAINLDADLEGLIGRGVVDVFGDVRALPFKGGALASVQATRLPSLLAGQYGRPLASEIFRS